MMQIKDQMGMIPVPGGRVWYRSVAADRDGTPLLVLHGGPGAPHDYLENLSDLADERPVIFYDQLGCGRSERPDDSSLWNLPRFVSELAAVRSALRLERLYLLGQSWGALLAISYLLEHGTCGVAGLILSGPLLSSPAWMRDQRMLLEQMPDDVQDVISLAERENIFDTPAYQAAMDTYYRRHLCRLDPWPDCLQRTFEQLGLQVYLTMWGPSEFTCTGNLAQVDLMPRLGGLDLPVLITCGRHDEATPATCEAYRELIPSARLVMLEDASHEHHLEQPGRYLAAVRRFFASYDQKYPVTGGTETMAVFEGAPAAEQQ